MVVAAAPAAAAYPAMLMIVAGKLIGAVSTAVAMAVKINPTLRIFLKKGGGCDRTRWMSFFIQMFF